MLNAHDMERLINFQVKVEYIEALFYVRKTNRYGVHVVKKETR